MVVKRPVKILLLLVMLLMAIGGCRSTLTALRSYIPSVSAPREPLSTAQNKLANLTITARELGGPLLEVTDQSKIISMLYLNNTLFLALREQDSTSSLTAWQLKDGELVACPAFGSKNTLLFKSQQVMDLGLTPDGTVLVVYNGLKAYRDGIEIFSLPGKTTANRISVSRDGRAIYLYGNDHFDRVVVDNDKLKSIIPGFLAGRQRPFLGGLTNLDIDNGNFYCGGRTSPDGGCAIVSFNSSGASLHSFGSSKKTARDRLVDLVDYACTEKQLFVIDGFTCKLWTKEGSFLGELPMSKLLGTDTNAYRVIPGDDNRLFLLSYLRDAKSKKVRLRIFLITTQA